jgi:hypothetical protein
MCLETEIGTIIAHPRPQFLNIFILSYGSPYVLSTILFIRANFRFRSFPFLCKCSIMSKSKLLDQMRFNSKFLYFISHFGVQI